MVPLVARFAALARREHFDAVYSFLTWTNVLVPPPKLFRGRYRHIASEHAMADSLRSDGDQLAMLARTLPLVYRLPDNRRLSGPRMPVVAACWPPGCCHGRRG